MLRGSTGSLRPGLVIAPDVCVVSHTTGRFAPNSGAILLVVIAPDVLCPTTGRFAPNSGAILEIFSVLDQEGSCRAGFTDEDPVENRNNYCSSSRGPILKTGGDPVIHSNCHIFTRQRSN